MHSQAYVNYVTAELNVKKLKCVIIILTQNSEEAESAVTAKAATESRVKLNPRLNESSQNLAVLGSQK